MALLPLAALVGSAQAQSFDLAATPSAPGRIAVSPGTPYDGRFGYEPGSTAPASLFSVAVPEGNYRVTLRIGDREKGGVTTVKAESRRLMLRNIRTAPGAFVTRSFVVNVRTPALTPPPANAPGGSAVRLKPGEAGSFTWDDRLTLEFLGTPRIASIDIVPVGVPTVYLLGDSTVTDQRAEPAASWGQMLPAFFGADVAIANHAESGETLKSFLTELRLDKALSAMRPGDWMLLQFGHNDQKAQWPQTHADPVHRYPAYLRAYIAEARARGVTPVLVTSPERRTFDAAGRITSTLADHVAAMRRVAEAEGVALIDLNADSRALYEALGPARAPLAFNDGGADRTHHNNYGAYLLARAVAERIKAQLPALAAYLAPDIGSFDAHRPDPPEAIAIAPSLAHSAVRPAGN